MNSHDGIDVAGGVDGLDGVAQQPRARIPTPGVHQAAAGCKHSMDNLVISDAGDTAFNQNRLQ